MNIEGKIKEIIFELQDWDTGNTVFNADLDLTNDLGFSSIDYVRLIIEVENQFDIVVDDIFLEMDIVRNYKKLCDSIKRIVEDSKKASE